MERRIRGFRGQMLEEKYTGPSDVAKIASASVYRKVYETRYRFRRLGTGNDSQGTSDGEEMKGDAADDRRRDQRTNP